MRIFDTIVDDLSSGGGDNVSQQDRAWVAYKRVSRWRDTGPTDPGIWTGQLGSAIKVKGANVGIYPGEERRARVRHRIDPNVVQMRYGHYELVTPRPLRAYALHFEQEATENKPSFMTIPGTGESVVVGSLISFNAIRSIPGMWNAILPLSNRVFRKNKKVYV